MNMHRVHSALAAAALCFVPVAGAKETQKYKPILFARFDHYAKDLRIGEPDRLHFGPTTTVILGHPDLQERKDERSNTLTIFYLPIEKAKKRAAELLNTCGTDQNGNTLVARKGGLNFVENAAKLIKDEVAKQAMPHKTVENPT